MVCMSAATDEIVEKLKTLSVSIQAEYRTNEEQTRLGELGFLRIVLQPWRHTNLWFCISM